MKATIKTLAILTMAAASLAACGDDDNTENKNLKEYALQVKFNLIPNDSTVEAQLDKTIETAMSAIGLTTSQSNDLTTSQPYLYLAARDSADAAPKVQEIGKKLEDVLDKNKSQMSGSAYIMAIEKEQLEASDSKQRSWSCWYDAKYPAAENMITTNRWLTSTNTFYVYDLLIHNTGSFFPSRPGSERFNVNDPEGYCYRYGGAIDLNSGACGAYLFLAMSGVSKYTHPMFFTRLITDVVMINTGGDSHCPESVLIPNYWDGELRHYYPVTSTNHDVSSTKHDLNDGAGGPYLWMFYTTDYRDGWVLANNNTDKWETRVQEGRRRVDEETGYYMHAYKKNAAGEWADYGEANMNEGTKGDEIMLSLAFRKVL